MIITIVNDADGLVKLIDGQMAIKVGNERVAALPATGGPGTKLIYLLGGILTLGAGLLLMRRRTISYVSRKGWSGKGPALLIGGGLFKNFYCNNG